MIERTSAETRQHRAEIERIKQRWFNGEISMLQKQQEIREANLFFWGDKTSALAKRNLVVVAEPAVSRETKVPVLVPGRFADDDEDEREPWWQR